MTYYACTSLRYRDCGGGVGNSLEFGWKEDKGGRNYMGGIRHQSYYHLCECECVYVRGRERESDTEENWVEVANRRTSEKDKEVLWAWKMEREKKPSFVILLLLMLRGFIFFIFFKCLKHTQPLLRRLRTKISRRANGKNVVFFSVFAYCI